MKLLDFCHSCLLRANLVAQEAVGHAMWPLPVKRCFMAMYCSVEPLSSERQRVPGAERGA